MTPGLFNSNGSGWGSDSSNGTGWAFMSTSVLRTSDENRLAVMNLVGQYTVI